MYELLTAATSPNLDQERFEHFVKSLPTFDPALEEYLRRLGFRNESKGFCPPCRLVRTKGGRVELLDFSVHQDWKNGSFEPELQYSMEVRCYHLAPESGDFLWTKREKIIHGVTFSQIRSQLPILLEQALQMLMLWTSEVVMGNGQRKNQFWSLSS